MLVLIFFFKQKTAYEIVVWLEFRRVLFRSKSGKLYEVIGLALETETEELLVIYRPLYENEYELFARPASMFTETVLLDGKSVSRFQKINSEN